jgi:hypothetical protein
MSRTSLRGVLGVGDRVRFGGQVHTVAGLAGTTVRLVDSRGAPSLMMFTHLMAAEDFELLDSQAATPGLPPFGQLDTVPEAPLRKAQFFERHLIEFETGVPPDAPAGTDPRPEFDPLRLPAGTHLPLPLSRDRLPPALDRLDGPAARLIVGLAAIHAVRAVEVARLDLADANLTHRTLAVRRGEHHTVYLDDLSTDLVASWCANDDAAGHRPPTRIC